jgi:hypothetical protein
MNKSPYVGTSKWSDLDVVGLYCLVHQGKSFRRGVVVLVEKTLGCDTVYHVRLTRTKDNERISVLRPYLLIGTRRILCTCNEALATHHEGKVSLCQVCYRVSLEKAHGAILSALAPTYENGLDHSGSMSPQQHKDAVASISKAIETSTGDYAPIVWGNVNDGIDKSLGALNDMRNSAGLSDTVLPSTHPTRDPRYAEFMKAWKNVPF